MTLGAVETFIPITPTVFIRIESASARMRALHEKLNTEVLRFQEEWPYIPHLTVVKMGAEQPAQSAYRDRPPALADYPAARRISLERLTFVREDSANCWVDLAPVLLGEAWFPASS